MTRKKTLGVPAGLNDAGEALWSKVTGKYTLRADAVSYTHLTLPTKA